MAVAFPRTEELLSFLRRTPHNSVDALVLISGALMPENLSQIKAYLNESIRVLKNGGLLFVQGRPDYLPELGVYLDRLLKFKYWIAIQSAMRRPTAGLPTVHGAVLLFLKDGEHFPLKRVRFPHEYCDFCGRTLRDWGGKSHLMHPDGYAASDVWTSLTMEDNYTQLSSEALQTILQMIGVEKEVTYSTEEVLSETDSKRVIVAPREGIAEFRRQLAESPIQYLLPGLGVPVRYPDHEEDLPKNLWNVVHHGDALEVLREYPDNSIDLVFADPPYNLDKTYNIYEDEQEQEAYLAWCNAWLQEYIRILKPTGSLYLLNLPRWSMYHAAFLNQHLYFQNWIVWNALSEPRGKLMPAHYSLLFYTKSPTNFTFNYDQVREIEPYHYCLRASCVRKRRLMGINDKGMLTDIWSDVHRLKHRRDRDYHPCQLPDALMERIIRLSTNEGDIVLDALAGTGTTAVAAARLGRRYVAIEIDQKYVQIIKEKLAQVEHQGYIMRRSIRRPKPKYSKKALQLELRQLAARLGRLPTPQDVETLSAFGLQAFLEAFPTWGKALKAAKLEVQETGNGTSQDNLPRSME
jgi:site-specific DNA-methyltransferase (adenine-specific)